MQRAGWEDSPLEARRRTRLHRTRAITSFLEALAYLSPSLLLFVVFVFVPLARTFRISAYATDPLGRLAAFVGLRQYERRAKAQDKGPRDRPGDECRRPPDAVKVTK